MTMQILIADDHELMREALAQLLCRRWPQVQCAFAQDFAQTLCYLQSTTALICIVLDLRMPGMRSMDGARKVLSLSRNCPVIIWTGADDPRMVSTLNELGAFGVVFKSESSERLLELMSKIPAFNACPPDSALLQDASPAQGMLAAKQNECDSLVHGAAFTARQLDILRLLHDGRPNKLIADALNISLGTVKNHISLIFTKMQVRSRSELLSKTREWLL